MAQSTRTYGFTLLEIIVVIAIVAIFLGVATPRFIHTVRFGELRGTAERLVTTIRYAQGMAAIQRAPYRLVINIDNNTFYLARDAVAHDDFAFDESDLVTPQSSLFPGQPMRTTPFSRREDTVDTFFSREDMQTNAPGGRVAIFDGETEFIAPRDVSILRVVDARGDIIEEGTHTMTFSPQGMTQETRIYLSFSQDDSVYFIVDVAYNGTSRMYRQENL